MSTCKHDKLQAKIYPMVGKIYVCAACRQKFKVQEWDGKVRVREVVEKPE